MVESDTFSVLKSKIEKKDVISSERFLLDITT